MNELIQLFSDVARFLGVPHYITSRTRTRAQQVALQRRPRGFPVARVSTHEAGLAFDAVAVSPQDQLLLGLIWEYMGFYWGGRFRPPDPIHFQVIAPAAWIRLQKTL